MAWSRGQPGFTLLELLIVMTLMAMLAGAVVVALQGRDQPHALRVTAEDLASALRYASQEARSDRQPCRVIFDASQTAYHVEEQSQSPEPQWVAVEGMAGQTHWLAGGVVVAQSAASATQDQNDSTGLAFSFDGTGGGFAGDIELQDTAKDRVKIQVMPRTGQVSIVKESDDAEEQ